MPGADVGGNGSHPRSEENRAIEAERAERSCRTIEWTVARSPIRRRTAPQNRTSASTRASSSDGMPHGLRGPYEAHLSRLLRLSRLSRTGCCRAVFLVIAAAQAIFSCNLIMVGEIWGAMSKRAWMIGRSQAVHAVVVIAFAMMSVLATGCGSPANTTSENQSGAD